MNLNCEAAILRTVVFLGLLTSFIVAPVRAQAQNLDQCISSNLDADAKIQACTLALADELGAWRKQSTITLSLRGWAWKVKGEIDRAIEDFTAAIRIDANYVPAYKGRADLYRDQKLCGLAIADYNEAIRLQPDKAQNYVGRGLCFVEQQDVDRALADFDEAIKREPTDKSQVVTAWSMKALLHSTKGQLDLAMTDCGEAIRLDPDRTDLYVERGSLWTLKGNDEKALADFDFAIKRDSNNDAAIPALMQKAALHTRKGDIGNAIADYDEAIKRDPTRPPLFTERAALWRRQGNNEKALADYTQAIAVAPKNPVPYNLRGGLYRDLGEYDKAMADFDKAIETRPDASPAYGSRALIRFYKGDFANAAADFKKAGDAQPSIYSQLWLYLSRMRDTTKGGGARDDLSKAFGNLTDSKWPFPIMQLYLGKQSAAAIQSAAKTDQQKCEAQFYVGEMQLLAKNRDRAIDALQMAADKCPKGAAEYLGAISELQRLKG